MMKSRLDILYVISTFGLLLLNPCQGQLSFTDITGSAGTGGPTGKNELGGHGAMFADVDGDGRPDLYITMIFTIPMPELFFHNLGNNTFANEGKKRGIADFDGGSHGGCWADLDNDGDYDLFNGTTWDHPKYRNFNNIFKNNGKGNFQEVTPNALKKRTELTRGVLCFDLDNDGAGNFTAGAKMPVKGINDPRGVAFADIDNDGDLDFAFGVKRSRNWLIRNDYSGKKNWLKVKLISPQGQAGAFGAKIYIYPAGQKIRTPLAMRESKSNYGYLGQDDPVLHFGLGRRTVVKLVVRFLDATTLTYHSVKANQTITINAAAVPPIAPAI